MKLLKETDILHNKKLVIVLNLVALILFLAFLPLFYRLGLVIQESSGRTLVINPLDPFLALLCFLIILVVHELIHGLFFKIFKPENKVTFGIVWKSGMAYATSPGSHYTRVQMLVITLAPFVCLTSFLTLIYALNLMSLMGYTLLAAMHAAGCTGDFYYTYLLTCKFTNQKILVEDTESGLRIYGLED